ncbi:MAG: hypothetical protein IT165_20080 [Bryobacterales bacterium]|nr:hypothetical protein [Bryobacterales bacterium]
MKLPLQAHADEEPPPFLGTWERVYGAVVIYLAMLIVLFYTFSAIFTPPPSK